MWGLACEVLRGAFEVIEGPYCTLRLVMSGEDVSHGFKVGQRVLDKKGNAGTVMYIGPVATSKSAETTYVGGWAAPLCKPGGALRRAREASPRLHCVVAARRTGVLPVVRGAQACHAAARRCCDASRVN